MSDIATAAAEIARLQAKVKELRNDYLRICRGHDQLHDERDECRDERDRLQAEVEQYKAALSKSAREVGFLRTAFRINMIRHGESDSDIDEILARARGEDDAALAGDAPAAPAD